jgi:hypothetical protein
LRDASGSRGHLVRLNQVSRDVLKFGTTDGWRAAFLIGSGAQALPPPQKNEPAPYAM